MARRSRLGLIAVVVVLALLVAGFLWWAFLRVNNTKITAYFETAVGVYPDSDVRVLGVKVGSVDSVEPEGDQVKVVMTVNSGVEIPDGVKAAQVTPSLVADRYVQLAPAYTGGAKLGKDATIPRGRTATPVEVDAIYEGLKDVFDTFGPNGVNEKGVLNDAVTTAAANLNGNGDALGSSITQLADAARTLSDYRGDFAGTVKNLQTFVSALAANDGAVRQFNSQLATFNSFLASERDQLGRSLNELSIALGEVARFVNENSDRVGSSIAGLVTVTETIVKNSESFAEALLVGPVALDGILGAYNAESGTLDTRANFPELQDPLGAMCGLIDVQKMSPGNPAFERVGRQIQPLIDQCKAIAGQITAGVKTPGLVLPFGILSGDTIQLYPAPGTVAPNPNPELEGGN